MGEQLPSVGRVVHFYENDAQQKPFVALVIAVHSDKCINLVFWNEGGTQGSRTSVLQAESGTRWCWPPRA